MATPQNRSIISSSNFLQPRQSISPKKISFLQPKDSTPQNKSTTNIDHGNHLSQYFKNINNRKQSKRSSVFSRKSIKLIQEIEEINQKKQQEEEQEKLKKQQLVSKFKLQDQEDWDNYQKILKEKEKEREIERKKTLLQRRKTNRFGIDTYIGCGSNINFKIKSYQEKEMEKKRQEMRKQKEIEEKQKQFDDEQEALIKQRQKYHKFKYSLLFPPPIKDIKIQSNFGSVKAMEEEKLKEVNKYLLEQSLKRRHSLDFNFVYENLGIKPVETQNQNKKQGKLQKLTHQLSKVLQKNINSIEDPKLNNFLNNKYSIKDQVIQNIGEINENKMENSSSSQNSKKIEPSYQSKKDYLSQEMMQPYKDSEIIQKLQSGVTTFRRKSDILSREIPTGLEYKAQNLPGQIEQIKIWNDQEKQRKIIENQKKNKKKTGSPKKPDFKSTVRRVSQLIFNPFQNPKKNTSQIQQNNNSISNNINKSQKQKQQKLQNISNFSFNSSQSSISQKNDSDQNQKNLFSDISTNFNQKKNFQTPEKQQQKKQEQNQKNTPNQQNKKNKKQRPNTCINKSKSQNNLLIQSNLKENDFIKTNKNNKIDQTKNISLYTKTNQQNNETILEFHNKFLNKWCKNPNINQRIIPRTADPSYNRSQTPQNNSTFKRQVQSQQVSKRKNIQHLTQENVIETDIKYNKINEILENQTKKFDNPNKLFRMKSGQIERKVQKLQSAQPGSRKIFSTQGSPDTAQKQNKENQKSKIKQQEIKKLLNAAKKIQFNYSQNIKQDSKYNSMKNSLQENNIKQIVNTKKNLNKQIKLKLNLKDQNLGAYAFCRVYFNNNNNSIKTSTNTPKTNTLNNSNSHRQLFSLNNHFMSPNSSQTQIRYNNLSKFNSSQQTPNQQSQPPTPYNFSKKRVSQQIINSNNNNNQLIVNNINPARNNSALFSQTPNSIKDNNYFKSTQSAKIKSVNKNK